MKWTAEKTAAEQTYPTRFRGSVDILRIIPTAEKPDDTFIFESLWYGRASFVVDSAERAEKLIARFVELLRERRATRARVDQTVHIVWDMDKPMPDALAIIAVLIPTTSPSMLRSGPPLLPGLMEASV